VVKALNTMNCQVMVDPGRVPGEHNAFLCGNDDTAKAAPAELITSFGWPAGSVIDLGDISAARGTEMLLPLWLRLTGAFGYADFNFHIAHAWPIRHPRIPRAPEERYGCTKAARPAAAAQGRLPQRP
jgi:8-hydroxy-5-deazaflavin:NADPH oxidoreductase